MNSIAGLIVLLAGLLLQQPRPGSVEGVVLRIGTTDPVAKAVVELRTSNGAASTMATGSDGRFQFRISLPDRINLPSRAMDTWIALTVNGVRTERAYH